MQLVLATATAFSLVCSGTETDVNTVSEPYEVRYSIDLDRCRWCEGQCTVVNDIVGVTGDIITLRDGPIPRYRTSTIWRNAVDRRNGEHVERRLVTGTVVVMGTVRRGQCREEPLAGFPGISG